MLRFDATRLVRNVQEKAVEVITQSAADVLDISQQFVPVDTGALKASGGSEVVVGSEQVVATIGYGNDEVNYALHVEYGTSNSAAQPYLTPAMAEAESIVEERARQVMKSLSDS
jgi:HK97 gp10 family phage protein